MENIPTFLQNHGDTIAIIGVNIAIAAIMISMWLSHSHRIDSSHDRIDSSYQVMMERWSKEK
jgi:hypothetical protein